MCHALLLPAGKHLVSLWAICSVFLLIKISSSITTNEASDLNNQIRALKDKVERLMI